MIEERKGKIENSTLVEVEYVSRDGRDVLLAGVKGFSGYRERGRGMRVATFEVRLSNPEAKFLTRAKEDEFKEILGENLRGIKCYKELGHKFYNQPKGK